MDVWMLIEGVSGIQKYFVYDSESIADVYSLLSSSRFVHVRLKGYPDDHFVSSDRVIAFGSGKEKGGE